MKKFNCVLITGASSGLGEEFAKQLASQAETLILVARRGDRLSATASALMSSHRVQIKCFEADLADEQARTELIGSLTEKHLLPDLLINNAGLGDYGTFADSSWDKIKSMLRVNMEALTHLTHLCLPHMIQTKGAIMHVSSLASTLAIPDFTVYAATKAYVSSFSEALRIELLEYRIPVLALCPGPVHTEFGNVAMNPKSEKSDKPFKEFFYVAKEQVVAEALIGLERNAARVYPGWKIALAAAGISLLPLAALRLIMSSRPRR